MKPVVSNRMLRTALVCIALEAVAVALFTYWLGVWP